MSAVYVSAANKALLVRDQGAIAQLFPNTPVCELYGEKHRVLKHDLAETLLLRKMGFKVPSPMLTQYAWPGGEPFEVQRKTCNMMTVEPRCYVLNSMGTGKTKAACWAFDYLRGNKRARKMLVVTKYSIVNTVWLKEVFETTPHLKAVSLRLRSKEQRLKVLVDPDADIYVINHDGVGVIFDELMARDDIDTICIDELASFRNNVERSKRMRKLCNRKCVQWVWGLTGSPMPNEPVDVWMQSQIITPWTSPKYRQRCKEHLMYKVDNFKWLPKPDATEEAFKILQPAVRFTLDDVTELPEMIERQIDVEMSDRQKLVYTQLVKNCQAMVDNKQITALNAGAAMVKLLQVASGWAYTKDTGTVNLNDEGRAKALIDIIESTPNKVLVFSAFRHTCEGIAEILRGADPEKPLIEAVTVHGGVSGKDRDEIFWQFQNTDRIKVINAHPGCMAHGLTLTAADTVVWWGPTASLETFEQANARIRRIGQKHKQQFLYLQGTPVERRVYALLRKKAKVQNQLLQLFADATE